MKYQNGVRCVLAAAFVFSPMAANLSFAQEAEKPAVESVPVKVIPVSGEETALLKQLAKQGALGDKSDSILKSKSLTQEQLAEALTGAASYFSKVELASLKEDKTYKAEDIQNLLKLVKTHKELLWAKKVPVWSLEKKLNKMAEVIGTGPEDGGEKEAAVPAPAPQPTAVPVVTKADWEEMKETVQDLGTTVRQAQKAYDSNAEDMQKRIEESRKIENDTQEQLKLVKRIMDQVQSNMGKLEDRLDATSKKAAEKTLTDDELKQELTILRKDLRDNSQDVSVLKQQLAKLDKSGEVKAQSPLDDALSSKWLAGGALVVGLAALVVALTKQ